MNWNRITAAAHRRLKERIARRRPDLIIGTAANPYLLRWYLIPRNRFLNVYLHQFLRSDDDRALHDHPWASVSWLLAGGYAQHTISHGGINRHERHEAGAVIFRGPWHAHRIEIGDQCAWTLFVTGPRVREWGFHCTERGWVHWKDFTAPHNSGETGRGCDA